MQKLKNVEFLRTILIWMIVIFHMRVLLLKLPVELYSTLRMTLSNSRNAVEGFFIIAGFILILTFRPDKKFAEFFKQKYIMLAPAAIFSVVVCGIAGSMGIIKFKLESDIVSALLLSNFGTYWCVGTNYPLWIISSLLFGFVALYFVLKNVKECDKLAVFVTISAICYTILTIAHKGQFSGHTHVLYGFLAVSTLRVLGDMCVGCAIGQLYKKYETVIKDWVPSSFNKLFINVLELGSFAYIMWWSCCVHKKINNIFYVYAFIILFVCFLCKKGWLSKLVDKDMWANVGRYSYSILVMHAPVILILYHSIWKKNVAFVTAHNYIPLVCDLLIVLAVGVLTYYYIEKPSLKYLSEKWLKPVQEEG